MWISLAQVPGRCEGLQVRSNVASDDSDDDQVTLLGGFANAAVHVA